VHSRHLIWVLPALIYLLPGNSQQAIAEDTPPESSLETLHICALANSLAVKRIDAGFAEQVATALGIEQMENPELDGALNVPVSYGGEKPKNELSISLKVPIRPGDFGVRTRTGELVRSVASLEKQIELQAYLGKLSRVYSSLWALHAQKRYLAEQQKEAKSVVQLLANPASVGQFQLPQKLTAEATVAKLESHLLGTRHALAQKEAELTKLSGCLIESEHYSRPTLEALPEFSEIWAEIRSNPSGLVKRYSLQAQLKEQELALANSEQISAFAPHLEYSRNDDGDHFVGIGVALPLPIFNRNNSKRKLKSSQTSISKNLLQYVTSPIFQDELRLIHSGIRAKHRQAKTYEEKVLPALREASKSSEELFRNGQLSLFELWTAQNEFNAALKEGLALWLETFDEALKLSLLTGRDLL
jgi:outer membrane protein TolC